MESWLFPLKDLDLLVQKCMVPFLEEFEQVTNLKRLQRALLT